MWIRGHFENKRSGSFAELVIEQVHARIFFADLLVPFYDVQGQHIMAAIAMVSTTVQYSASPAATGLCATRRHFFIQVEW